ncbi:MAG: hypothetical protein Q9191_008413 [Dirinaria sp. TL-2023a]
MKTSRNPAQSSIIFALALLLLPSVHGYDCNILTNTKCSPNYSGPRRSPPECLVNQLSASAFIQCASQKGSPNLVSTDDEGERKTQTPLEVLISALSAPECDACPLAGKIQNVAITSNSGGSFGPADFGTNLCNAQPADVGMCCLKNCLGGSPEHSIAAFCAGKDFITQAPLLPGNCVSNREPAGPGYTGDDDTTSSSSGVSGFDTSSSGVGGTGGSSSTTPAQQVSPSTNLPTTTSATRVSTSNAGPTPQATTPTIPSSGGAALGRQHTLMDWVRKLGVAVLPLAAAF